LELLQSEGSLLRRGFYSFKKYEFEGIEIALEGIWYEDNRNFNSFEFIFFKSLCGGERSEGMCLPPPNYSGDGPDEVNYRRFARRLQLRLKQNMSLPN
jgi:hypothetical protein